MRFRPILYFCLFLCVCASLPALAQNDGTLHVIRLSLRADQEKPELCLEFDHPIEGDSSHIQSALRLEADGKTIPPTLQNISVVAENLCLSGLDYRHDYRLIVAGLRGAANEKLTEPYHLTFTVPDRHASLTFAASGDGMMRWNESDPVLRGINVAEAKIELYHVTDPALMTEAWRQRGQVMLAPSESAYFARHNGQLLWQGDIVLPNTPNQTAEQKVPLRAALAGNLGSGLYLVVASAPAPKDAADKELGPLAATWLLRSGVTVRGLRGFDHVYAIADQSDGASAAKDVHFILEDANQQSLAEGKSDENGVAALSLAPEKMNDVASLIGLTPTGDVAFSDLLIKDDADLTLPGFDAAINTDKPFYAPDNTVDLQLVAHDVHNRPALPANSLLELLRPDHNFYTSIPVPKDQNGAAHVTFPVPLGNGLWILDWKRAGGDTLAERNLRITTNEAAPHLELSADHVLLAESGEVSLTIKSIMDTGKPAPYIAGHITLSWTSPDHLFPGWDDYHFGNGKEGSPATTDTLAAFITDDKGVAQLHLNLPVSASGATALHTALLTAVADAASGAASAPSLHLPVRAKDFIVGIRAAAPDGKFAENSGAHFDVIALDGDGKRRGTEGLSYRIYEEGRSFEWYQTDGRWDYKPEPQQRRIAGGSFTIKGDEAAAIDWQGAAGTYRLDVTDASGTILARMDFGLGWEENAAEANSKPAPLDLTPPTHLLKVGDAANVHFKLSKDAMITAVLADDHIRKVIHEFRAAGDNDVGFTPQADWGNAIKITIEANTSPQVGTASHFSGQITLPLGGALEKTADKSLSAAAANLPALDISMPSLPPLKIGDQIQCAIDLKNNTALPVSYHYVFSAPSDLKLAGTPAGIINLTPGQTRTLNITAASSQAGTKELKLEVTGTHNLHSSRSWPIVVATAHAGLSDQPEEILEPQKSWPTKMEKKGAKAGKGFVFVSPLPLEGAPGILADALQMHAFTTKEIASEAALLHLWHDVIIKTELVPLENLALRERHLVMRLLERQLPDGGFPAFPDNTATMSDTADALLVLSLSELPLAKPAALQAAEWLKRHLDNDWFDEQERPERAAAYAAMAAVGSLDAGSLRHFSDTSAQKSLPPLAALQMSAAFARINDGAASAFWLNAAHIDKNVADIPSALLPWLAGNAAFDAHALLPALQKLSADISQKTLWGEPATSFLRALGQIESREGIWRVSIDGNEQNLKNIFVTALSEKPPLTLRAQDKPIYVTETRLTKNALPKDDTITRHIYRMDGKEVMADEYLTKGETYLVADEGAWRDESGPVLIRDMAAPALTPMSCAFGGNLEMDESQKWLKEYLPIATPACEKMPGGIDLLLAGKEGDAKAWHIAYLAKANWRGSFDAGSLEVRAIDGSKPSREGRSDPRHVE